MNSHQPGDDVSPAEDPIPPAPLSLVELAMSSTVRLQLVDEEGSGVVLGRDDQGFVYILTVWHAARKEIERIEFFESSSFEPFARLPLDAVVAHCERLDLAVLRVKADSRLKFTSVPLAQASDGPDPRFAYSSGCDSQEFPTVLTERITGKKRLKVKIDGLTAEKWPVRVMWITEIPQGNGRSGGALINIDGQLIGLALGKAGTSGYYCHVEEISDYLIDSDLGWLVRCDTTGN